MINSLLNDMSKCFDLSGKVAIVTGGGGILGRHFCAGLAQYGATVIVADLLVAAAEDTAAAIDEQFQLKTFPCRLDVSVEESVQELVKNVVAEHGRIDILHNNAASKSSRLERFFDPVETFDMKIWQEIMQVNVDGMFLMARHVGGQMAKQDSGGSIIQTASIYGLVAPDQRIYEGSSYMGMPINTPAVYSVSKAAVIGLTQYLSTYWLGKNIRVNTLTPGGIESGQNDVFQNKYSARVPLGRMAKAEEMVGALIFLASNASSYITGQNLVVDGGLSVW
jgi:NAD(P)-dependent dehydrogenase (short-subunit alcohol dehydrogenase family)